MKIGEIWQRKEKWRKNLSARYSGKGLDEQMGKFIISDIKKELVYFQSLRQQELSYRVDTIWNREMFLREFEKVYE